MLFSEDQVPSMASNPTETAAQDIEKLFQGLVRDITDEHETSQTDIKQKVLELQGRFSSWSRRTKKLPKIVIGSSQVQVDSILNSIKQLNTEINNVRSILSHPIDSLPKDSNDQIRIGLKAASNLIMDLHKTLSILGEANKASRIATELKLATKLWRYAQEAYTILQDSLHCECSELHCVDLTLPTSSIQYAQLSVVFNFSAENLTLDATPPWTRRAAVLKRSMALFDTNLTQSPDSEQFPAHPLTIGSTTSLGKQVVPNAPRTVPQDLCVLLRTHDEQLGDLSSVRTLPKYSLVADENTPSCKVITLKERLSLASTSAFSRVTRYSLALDIVRAHMQLHPSNWLGSEWRADDIIFITNPPEEANRPRLRRFIRNSTISTGNAFHSLGILLLELCFGQSIDDSGYREHSLPESAQEKYWRDVSAAFQWLTRVEEEAGPAYHNAVSWLLEPTHRDSEAWRENMREHTVGPLRVCLETLTSPSSRIYSPVRSFAAIRRGLLEDVETRAALKLKQRRIFRHIDTVQGRVSATRAIFMEQEETLEDLFVAAEIERQSLNMTDEDDILQSIRDKPTVRQFRQAIIGPDGEHSRTQILAILLVMDVSPTSTTWDRFIDTLDLDQDLEIGERQVVCPRDSELPLLEFNRIAEFLGSAAVSSFMDRQYQYCAPFIDKFNEQREILRRGLDRLLIRYSSTGDKTHKHLGDIWCSTTDVVEFMKRQESAVKDLYVQYEISRLKKSSAVSEQWRTVRAAKENVELFWNGVLHGRMKIFAILIYSSVPADADAWMNYVRTCLGNSSEPDILDKDLPFDQPHIESCFALDDYVNGRILQDQMIFCDIVLQSNYDGVVSGSEYNRKHPLRLPLMEKTSLGRGVSGEVFKVKIRKGHYSDSSEDKELAMKQTRLAATYAKELLTLKWLFDERWGHRAITRVCASLVTPDNIYFFMELADANLYNYMTEEKYQPRVPLKEPEWKRMLNKIIDVAEGLEYLHCHLWGQEDRKHMICYHQDIKPENILVKNTDTDPVFQIADFGISRIKRAPKDTNGKLDPTNLFDREATDYSTLPAKGYLGDECRNLAPELRANGVVTAAVDVWAFGVVLSEYVAWLAGGEPMLRQFEMERKGDQFPEDDKTPQGGNAPQVNNSPRGNTAGNHMSFHIRFERWPPVVKAGVRNWLRKLETLSFSEDLDYRQPVLSSCARLLEHKLLVCEPRKRAGSQEICQHLRDILQHGRYWDDDFFERNFTSVVRHLF